MPQLSVMPSSDSVNTLIYKHLCVPILGVVVLCWVVIVERFGRERLEEQPGGHMLGRSHPVLDPEAVWFWGDTA